MGRREVKRTTTDQERYCDLCGESNNVIGVDPCSVCGREVGMYCCTAAVLDPNRERPVVAVRKRVCKDCASVQGPTERLYLAQVRQLMADVEATLNAWWDGWKRAAAELKKGDGDGTT